MGRGKGLKPLASKYDRSGSCSITRVWPGSILHLAKFSGFTRIVVFPSVFSDVSVGMFLLCWNLLSVMNDST